MKYSFLENIISFLLGVLWTLLGVSVFVTFMLFYHSGILFAIAVSFLVVAFWLFLIVIVEMAHIQIEKLKELQKQTRFLQSLHDSLSHH